MSNSFTPNLLAKNDCWPLASTTSEVRTSTGFPASSVTRTPTTSLSSPKITFCTRKPSRTVAPHSAECSSNIWSRTDRSTCQVSSRPPFSGRPKIKGLVSLPDRDANCTPILFGNPALLSFSATPSSLKTAFAAGINDSPTWGLGKRDRSNTTVFKPLRASIVAAVEPAGPPPITTQSALSGIIFLIMILT